MKRGSGKEEKSLTPIGHAANSFPRAGEETTGTTGGSNGDVTRVIPAWLLVIIIT